MKSQEALALARKYTTDTAEGAGAVKGKNCVIKSIDEIDGGNRVTFQWTLDNGTVQTRTMDVMDGEEGQQGEKGEKGDKGNQGQQGENGEDGFSPEIKVSQNTPSTYKLNIKTKDSEFETPNLKGGGGGTATNYSVTNENLIILFE